MTFAILAVVILTVQSLADNSTTAGEDEEEEYDYADYLDRLEAEWSTKQAAPCGDGEPLARMICLPWNYTKEYRPDNTTEVRCALECMRTFY